MITQWRIVRGLNSFDLRGFHEIVKSPLKTANHNSPIHVFKTHSDSLCPTTIPFFEKLSEESVGKRECLNSEVHFLTTRVQ